MVNPTSASSRSTPRSTSSPNARPDSIPPCRDRTRHARPRRATPTTPRTWKRPTDHAGHPLRSRDVVDSAPASAERERAACGAPRRLRGGPQARAGGAALGLQVGCFHRAPRDLPPRSRRSGATSGGQESAWHQPVQVGERRFVDFRFRPAKSSCRRFGQIAVGWGRNLGMQGLPVGSD
jgi:hypothetical protein